MLIRRITLKKNVWKKETEISRFEITMRTPLRSFPASEEAIWYMGKLRYFKAHTLELK